MNRVGNGQAQRWIEAARTVAPEYVWGPLSPSAHAALEAVCDLRISVCENIQAPFVTATLPDGSTRLVLNSRLPQAARQAIRLFAVFTHWRPRACPRPKQALLAAVGGVLHAEGLRSYGAAWQVAVVEELKWATPLWEIAPLYETLLALNGILPAVCPVAAVPQGLPAREVYELGRVARSNGDFAMAAALLTDSFRRARVEGDGETAVLALNARGTVDYRLGNFIAARRAFRLAVRECARQGVPEFAWGPLHDLFALETQAGRHAAALRHALAAYEAYGSCHPRLPRFAHDVAWYFVEAGYYLRALRLARSLAVAFNGHAEHVRALATLAHAAGGAGDLNTVVRVGRLVEHATRADVGSEPLANALTHLARGYLLAGMYSEAERAANRAVDVAASTGERVTLGEARAVALASARRERLPQRAVRLTNSQERSWDTLVNELSNALVAHGADGAAIQSVG